LPEVKASTFSDIRFADGGKVVALHACRFLPPEDSWYSFLLEAEATHGYNAAERIRSIEEKSTVSMTRTTFRFVA
jgi:hypothetical protein